MSPGGAEGPRRLLLVGGGGGLLGRAVLREFLATYRIRSVHRHPAPIEAGTGVEWVSRDVATVTDWEPLLEGVDVVLNVAWYRSGSESRFRTLYEGLAKLLEATRRVGPNRFLHVSVPEAPRRLETKLPYLVYKRRFDHELSESGLRHRIVRPTMMFGEGDRLLTVMIRQIYRWRRFPMFGDGEYHVSPISARDVAAILHLEAEGQEVGTIDTGGPDRFRYRDLTDLMFRTLGLPSRYRRLSPRTSMALARLLQSLGSTLLYSYEVEWLLSDRLGLSPASGLDRPLDRVEPFLREQAGRFLPPRVGQGKAAIASED